jgi:hypothetical protein
MEYISAIQGVFTALFLLFMIPAIYGVVKSVREPQRKPEEAYVSLLLAFLGERHKHQTHVDMPRGDDSLRTLRGVERLYDAQGRGYVLINVDALDSGQILLVNADKWKKNLSFDDKG